MKVTTISVNIRYSQDTGAGAWKTIEVGAEATLSNSGEDWESSQRELYSRLSEQLKAVWSGKADAQYAQEGHRIDAQPAKEHYCQGKKKRGREKKEKKEKKPSRNLDGMRKEIVSGTRISWAKAGTMNRFGRLTTRVKEVSSKHAATPT